MTKTHHEKIPAAIRATFDETLKGLEEPETLLREQHVRRLLSQVDILTDSREGMELLLEHVPRLIEADVFRDTIWVDPERLVPTLAAGTLRVGGETTLYEILSELRMVALARGTARQRRFSGARARDFLEQVLVNNLKMFYAPEPGDDPVERKLGHLTALVTEEIPLDAMKEVLASEIELICAQRPVVTDRVLDMIRVLGDRIALDAEREQDRRLMFFMKAGLAPSRESADRTLASYGDFLAEASEEALEEECRELSRRMRETGLAVGYHALMLRRVADDPRLLALALGVDAAGRAELVKHQPFVAELIRDAIHPETARSCYGLSLLLNRGLLSQQPVKTGLGRFTTLRLYPDVAQLLREGHSVGTAGGAGGEANGRTTAGADTGALTGRATRAPSDGGASGGTNSDAITGTEAPDPRALLLADCLGILGQPLGVGQGGNPTCQSARGISLWSRHAPGKLLGMIETTATTNDLSMRFEGQAIQASTIAYEMAGGFDRKLDAVSLVLVPHLDRVYNEMMRRSSFRGEDPHKWVNPAMYGHWIPHGFTSAYDYATDSIRGYDDFLRTFYITHHPDYNGGHDLAYPNPVGIFLTSAGGALIGFHAVSIVRVRAKSGQMRVYFVNPNNEGRQQWQAEIRPTVAGNGERPGESSLPFRQFASRLYAFHFSPSEVGDPERVDPEEIERVTAISKSSWGPSYRWTDAAGFPST